MGVKTRNLSNTVGLDIEWQGVQTGNFTAVAGRGYFVDTTNAAITVTLPGSPSQGDTVVLKDYARKWGTNAVSIASTLFDGSTNAATFSTNGQTVTLIYMDGTKGWSLINEDTTSTLGAEFISATGGTVTESGDYKIHTFTGDGCFVVASLGNPLGGPNVVDYLVVAGGGGGSTGDNAGGAGGAGGFRFASPSLAPLCYPAKPLAGSTLPVSVQGYPVTVGAGGSAGASGNNSVFSTITSAGGGSGGTTGAGVNGGSGGGGGSTDDSVFKNGGTGNTPPTSPSQGNNGGRGRHQPTVSEGAGGGGGAISAGTDGDSPPSGGPGGTGGTGGGLPTAFGSNGVPSGSFRYYAGGGGGSGNSSGPGGLGGGGLGASNPNPAGAAGTANTGGGGGGGFFPGSGGAGGSGIVIIRYKFQ